MALARVGAVLDASLRSLGLKGLDPAPDEVDPLLERLAGPDGAAHRVDSLVEALLGCRVVHAECEFDWI